MNRIPHPRRPMCSPSFFTAGALPRRLLASLVLGVVPALATAQNVITLRADSTRRIISPSSNLAVPVILDMSAAGGINLAALTTRAT